MARRAWATFYRYDEESGSGSGGGSWDGGHLLVEAYPSAVTGYDDGYADLVNYAGVLLEVTRESPVELFRLDGRPHFAGVSVPRFDLGAYHALRAGGGA